MFVPIFIFTAYNRHEKPPEECFAEIALVEFIAKLIQVCKLELWFHIMVTIQELRLGITDGNM